MVDTINRVNLFTSPVGNVPYAETIGVIDVAADGDGSGFRLRRVSGATTVQAPLRHLVLDPDTTYTVRIVATNVSTSASSPTWWYQPTTDTAAGRVSLGTWASWAAGETRDVTVTFTTSSTLPGPTPFGLTLAVGPAFLVGEGADILSVCVREGTWAEADMSVFDGDTPITSQYRYAWAAVVGESYSIEYAVADRSGLLRDLLEGGVPVTLYVFDKAYQLKGTVPAPQSVEWLGIFNGKGNLVFTVFSDSPRIEHLQTEGARVVVTLFRAGFAEEKTLLSGPVTELKGTGLTDEPLRVFTVEGDFGVFDEIVGWPVPGNPINNQNQEYHTITGPAGNVVYTALVANKTRQGVVVTGGTPSGIGPTMTAKFRMHPLSDQLFPKVTQLGVGVDIRQDPDETERRLIVWSPTTHTRVLTEESGVVLPGSEIDRKAPLTTRVVVGAGGDGTSRVWLEYIDAAAEALWGVSRSVFVDARDIEPTDPDILTLMQERADEAFAEGAETVSIRVELSETEYFQFGVAFEMGDIVPIKLASESVVSERITEVQLSWGVGQPLEITPRVGAYEESPDDRLYKLVAKALKTGRNLEVSK